MASSASTEQWIFTGRQAQLVDDVGVLDLERFVDVLPFSHSVASDELAMALPQPKVLNLASSIMPVSSLTLICSFITSPHSGAPTMPVPTLGRSCPASRRCAGCCNDPELCRNKPCCLLSLVLAVLMRDPLTCQIHALFRHLIERRKFAQLRDHVDDAAGDVIDFFFGVEAAQAEADRGVRQVVADAQGRST